MVWYGMVWYGMVWYGMVLSPGKVRLGLIFSNDHLQPVKHPRVLASSVSIAIATYEHELSLVDADYVVLPPLF